MANRPGTRTPATRHPSPPALHRQSGTQGPAAGATARRRRGTYGNLPCRKSAPKPSVTSVARRDDSKRRLGGKDRPSRRSGAGPAPPFTAAAGIRRASSSTTPQLDLTKEPMRSNGSGERRTTGGGLVQRRGAGRGRRKERT